MTQPTPPVWPATACNGAVVTHSPVIATSTSLTGFQPLACDAQDLADAAELAACVRALMDATRADIAMERQVLAFLSGGQP